MLTINPNQVQEPNRIISQNWSQLLTLTFYAFSSHHIPTFEPPKPTKIHTQHPQHRQHIDIDTDTATATTTHRDTIPEESSYQHGHSKSLCEPADTDDWEGAPLSAAAAGGANSERMMRSGREPLLPRPSNTPRAQIRRMNAGAVGGAAVSLAGHKNQVTKALLDYEDSETDSEENDDEDDDEDEDFDSYDDENIVVTTFTTPASGRRPGSSPASGSEATTTTTSIRLTRNNDESIIWVSSTDGDVEEELEADDDLPRHPKRSRRSLFPYEMFY